MFLIKSFLFRFVGTKTNVIIHYLDILFIIVLFAFVCSLILCQRRYFLLFRRLHLPRNFLHINLFVAFIFRSIIKLFFIHLIIGGYTRTMVSYRQDKCGDIEILSKSSNLFHVSLEFLH